MHASSSSSASQHAMPRATTTKAKPTCRKRPADPPMPEKGKGRAHHWATATYITVIWGCNFGHILEALVLGMALRHTSTRRRICFVNDVPREMEFLLNTIWETRQFSHLDMSEMKRTGASKRLSSVYYKLQAWSWLAGESFVI